MLRKKILYVTALYEGGIGRHLVSLLRHFSQSHRVGLASPQPTPSAVGRDCELEYYNLPPDGRNAILGNGNAMLRLTRICREWKPQLLHAHGFRAAMLALPAAALCPCPLVVTVHNYLAYPEKSFLPDSVFSGSMRRFGPMVSRYITVSEALRRYLTGWGIEPSRIRTIYNGVPGVFGDSPFIPVLGGYLRRPPWEKKKTKDAVIHIGTAGRLASQKGMDIFIRAAARLVDAYPRGRLNFYIAGEGPERDKLEKLRDSLGLQELLRFKGRILNMDAYLASLDIFTLASRSEGLSFSLLEAAAAGLPIVASSTGGIPEIISQGKTGLLVPPEDSVALAWALGRLVDDPQARVRMGTAALAEVKRRFTEKKMLVQTASLYREIMGPVGTKGKGKIYVVK